MTTIVITDLHPIDEKTFLHELTSEQINAISGNGILSLWSNDPDIALSTFHDGINNTSTTYHSPFGLYDNKIFTVDFSRLTIYLVI